MAAVVVQVATVATTTAAAAVAAAAVAVRKNLHLLCLQKNENVKQNLNLPQFL